MGDDFHCWRIDDGPLVEAVGLLDAMPGTMLSTYWSWSKLFSYAEVVCFVSAWAIGLLIAVQEQRPDQDRAARHSFAANSDSLGIQATLRK